MFGLSFGELLIIFGVALLVLGPKGLPQLARTLGKTLRQFRNVTGDLRSTMEGEFYRMDEDERPKGPVIAPARPVPPVAPEGPGAEAARPPLGPPPWAIQAQVTSNPVADEAAAHAVGAPARPMPAPGGRIAEHGPVVLRAADAPAPGSVPGEAAAPAPAASGAASATAPAAGASAPAGALESAPASAPAGAADSAPAGAPAVAAEPPAPAPGVEGTIPTRPPGAA